MSITLGETALSGAVSGVVGVVAPYPFDVIRCRQQANIASQLSMKRVAMKLLQESGPRVFFKGLTPAFCFYVPGQAVYFATYEKTKTFLKPRLSKDSPLVEGLAGAAASVIGYSFWTPGDNIAQRCQSTDSFKNKGRRIFSNIWRTEGIRGFYAGVGVSLALEIPMISTFWILYERLKTKIEPHTTEDGAVVGASFLASLVATWLSNPIELIKTQVQLNGPGGPKKNLIMQNVKRSTWQVTKEVLKRHSARQIFTIGLTARACTMVPDCVFGVYIFEKVKKMFIDSRAEGGYT